MSSCATLYLNDILIHPRETSNEKKKEKKNLQHKRERALKKKKKKKAENYKSPFKY